MSHYKVVVVGSSGVGKTSMVQRLIEGTFSEDSQATVGVEFKCFETQINEEQVKLNIWDTAGQEKYRSVSKAYFRNAVGGLLVFGFNDIESFQSLDSWLNDLQALSTPNAVILLVGNKSDLQGSARLVTSEDADEFAKRHGISYVETSALCGSNIQDAFIRLTNQIHTKVKKGEIIGNFQPPSVSPSGVPTSLRNDSGSSCKC